MSHIHIAAIAYDLALKLDISEPDFWYSDTTAGLKLHNSDPKGVDSIWFNLWDNILNRNLPLQDVIAVITIYPKSETPKTCLKHKPIPLDDPNFDITKEYLTWINTTLSTIN